MWSNTHIIHNEPTHLRLETFTSLSPNRRAVLLYRMLLALCKTVDEVHWMTELEVDDAVMQMSNEPAIPPDQQCHVIGGDVDMSWPPKL